MIETLRYPKALRWWDLAVAGVSIFVAYALIGSRIMGDPSMQGSWFWVGAAAWAALVVVYLAIGRTALLRSALDLPARPADAAFVVALVAATALATSAYPGLAVIQAVGYPMIWVLLRRYPAAVAGSIALAAAVGAGMCVSSGRMGDPQPWIGSSVTALLSLGFAIALGTWISRISHEGERQRRLVAELTEAQHEVARLSTEAGASAERERLSRELHDTLTQSLAGLVMLAEQAGRALDAGETERGRERIARVEAAARGAVAEARAIVASARPLGDGGLEAVLTRAAERLAEDAGLEVRCDFDSDAPLGREQQVVLLRVAQEGLSNARRHARATSVLVRLRGLSGDRVELAVVDDGVGPTGAGPRGADPGAAAADAAGTADPNPSGQATSGELLSGYGIAGLRERVELAGGELVFAAAPGGGSQLIARIPTGVALAHDSTDGAPA
ncbi:MULTISPECIES: sensor histidine kinase [unclassified Leucobacter]